MKQSDTDALLDLAAITCGLAALASVFARRAPPAPATPSGAPAPVEAPVSDLELAMALATRGANPSGPAEPLGPLASPSMQEALSYDPVQVSFDISATGDNVIVPAAFGYRIAVYEVSIWNTVQQDISIKNGSTVLKALPGFPAQAGYVLTLNQAPHWKLDYNQPFIINLSAGRLTGFLKYRMLEF